MTPTPPQRWRVRLAIFLLSLAVIGLEMAFMRVLALRFWHHFAYMVISVSMLGFGASGTALALARRRVAGDPAAWLRGLALAFALGAPLAYYLGRAVPLEVQFLAWEPRRQLWGIALFEMVMLAPFFLAGGALGAALMDAPERIGGHYAANLSGSGAGAVAAALLMNSLHAHHLVLAMATAAFAGGAALLPWNRPKRALAAFAPLAVCLAGLWAAPHRPLVSEYKMLAEVRRHPDAEIVFTAPSALGRLDVAVGPALHVAPGLSLRYEDAIPPHALLMSDGELMGAVYDAPSREDWRFMDYTLPAAAYRLALDPKVLVVGAGGGADIGLALYHGAADIVAVEMNRRLIRAMRGPLAGRGGRIYDAEGVRVVHAEARGFAASTHEKFDLIQIPPVDGFGASGGGLYAAQENYLYTVESFAELLGRLESGGVLCATRWARTPPRDGIRLFDIAAQALRRRGLEPAGRLAMLRSWATATVFASPTPFSGEALAALRGFAEERGFDLCYLPGMGPEEANRFHVLDRPYYYEAAQALLGPEEERGRFLGDYLFDARATTDDRPYFYHFFKASALPEFRKQLMGHSPAFLEVGYLLVAAAFVQTVCLAALLIVAPLLAGKWAERRAGRAESRAGCTPPSDEERMAGRTPPNGENNAPTGNSRVSPPSKQNGWWDKSRPAGRWWDKSHPTLAAFAYFLALGAGFMLLEMGFLQKFILYLASPAYSAAASIGGFLVFAGVGSWLSARWPAPPRRVILWAAGAVVAIALAYLAGLDWAMGWARPLPLPARFAAAVLAIAPLATAMGHLFPTGLRIVAESSPSLVPWAWAVNGCASVAATVGAPLLAMQAGFRWVVLAAMGFYAVAGVAGAALAGRGRAAAR